MCVFSNLGGKWGLTAIHQIPTHLATLPTDCIFAWVKGLDSVLGGQGVLRTPEMGPLVLGPGVVEYQAPWGVGNSSVGAGCQI